jgi:tetraacyldisaccharide 4'-kinase
LRIAALPLTLIFFIIVKIKNILYSSYILKQKKFPVKIISVGNVSAGGTGKSPFIIYLAERLISKGFKVGIISRGYGRETKGILTVFDGNNFTDDSAKTGDELNMIAQNLRVYGEKIYILASESRIKGAEDLLKYFKADYILLDDAYQHRKIFRDIDIVIVDTEEYLSKSLGYSLMIPSGRLREPYSEIKNADIVIQNNKQRIRDKINTLINLNASLVTANYICTGFYDMNSERIDIKDKNVIAFSGIAKPASFLEMIKSEGGKIIKSYIFDDHHKYTQSEIDKFSEYNANEVIFVTTEKDFVKIKYFDKFILNYKVFYLKINYKIENTGLLDKKIF